MDDAFAATVEFENGAIGTLEASRLARGRINQNTFELNGSRGSVAYDLERFDELHVSDESRCRVLVTEPSIPHVDWWPPGPQPRLGRHVHARAPPPRARDRRRGAVAPHGATFEDGYRAAEVCDAILRSAESGRRETIAWSAREDEPRHLGLRRDGHALRAGRLPARAGPTRRPRSKVHRAVEALGDLIDGYEFHYPQRAVAARTSTRCGRRSAATTSTASRAASTSTRASARAGSSRPTTPCATRRSRRTLEAVDFAGEIGAHFIIWPGIEGYNYPFQTPYARVLGPVRRRRSAQAAERARERGVTIFLEHKNSEPAMKILMRNMGMTLHVIHKLRAQGIDNVKVNMDWQHLIMNGENLAEYAALLAAEGLLGHQHANSGWGTFDDDNMVGATAFMETRGAGAWSCAAPATARTASGSASTSTRTPRTRSRPCGASVLAVAVHRRGRRADRRRRAARGAAGEGRGARVRARLRGARARKPSRHLTSVNASSAGFDPGPARRCGAATAFYGAVGLEERDVLPKARPGRRSSGTASAATSELHLMLRRRGAGRQAASASCST